jgi:hypothetical protein
MKMVTAKDAERMSSAEVKSGLATRKERLTRLDKSPMVS